MKLKLPEKIFIVFYIALAIFQISTTNIKEAYTYTPHQISLQIQRMNSYPPSLAKLGYILEAKKEVQILERVINNFFLAVDFKEYFPNRLPYILSPFLFVGLYFFIKERNKKKIIFYTFITSLGILTLIGPHAKYGPVLIMLYLIFFIVLGFSKLFRLKWL
ncbi:MAG: hypothetical protein P8Y17_00510 [Patescibacteria group bacterium]